MTRTVSKKSGRRRRNTRVVRAFHTRSVAQVNPRVNPQVNPQANPKVLPQVMKEAGFRHVGEWMWMVVGGAALGLLSSKVWVWLWGPV